MSDKQPSGVVNIKGRQYETVALRVQKFRAAHPDYRLITEIIHRDDVCVVMRACVYCGDSLLATGHAEEYRKASEINRTSALENCETSAIGRALAALGLGGTEFASADEVARAVSGAKGQAPVIKPVDSAMQGTEIDEGDVSVVAGRLAELAAEEGTEADVALLAYWESIDNDMRLACWKEWKTEPTFRSKLKARLERTRLIRDQSPAAA
jgi:hypothetical protein